MTTTIPDADTQRADADAPDTCAIPADFVIAADFVVRDDEADFSKLRDTAIASRRRGTRLRLVDTGRLTAFDLEWLGEAGAEIYTSDKAGRTTAEAARIAAATHKSGGSTAFLVRGGLAFDDLVEMARSGVALAISSKDRPFDLGLLAALAREAARECFPLVYYHHGPVGPGLEEVACAGAWIHVVATELGAFEDAADAAALARFAAKAGAGVVLHVDRAIPSSWLEDFFEGEGYAVFHLPPSDYRSPLRPLEELASRRLPGPRSGYLYPEFML